MRKKFLHFFVFLWILSGLFILGMFLHLTIGLAYYAISGVWNSTITSEISLRSSIGAIFLMFISGFLVKIFPKGVS